MPSARTGIDRERSRWWWGALAIVFVAGLLRVGYVLAVTQHQEFHSPDRELTVRSYDELWYERVAVSVAEGEGFRLRGLDDISRRTARHPPAAAVALAPAAMISHDDLPMRLTVAAAGTAVVLLVALIARRVAGDRAGLFAGALAAIHPYLWLNDGLVMAETFAALAATVAVVAALRLAERPGVGRALAVGVVVGIAALTRGELALLGPAFALALLVGADQVAFRRRVLLGGALGVGALLAVAPWTAYNVGRFEERVLLSTNDGDVLVGANCAETYGGELIGWHWGYCGTFVPETADEAVASLARREVALDYIADNAERLPLVVVARLGRVTGLFQPFWTATATQDEGRPRTAALAGWALSLATLPAVVAGALALRRRSAELLPVLVPIITVLVAAALTYGHPRFRAPAEPALVVLAGVGIAAWTRRGSPQPVDDAAQL